MILEVFSNFNNSMIAVILDEMHLLRHSESQQSISLSLIKITTATGCYNKRIHIFQEKM